MSGEPTTCPLVVNMASESDISVQGHGVHTAYVEMATALEQRSDVQVVRGRYHRRVDCDVYHLHTVGPGVWPKLLDGRARTVVSAHVIPDSLIGELIDGADWITPSRRMASWYLKLPFSSGRCSLVSVWNRRPPCRLNVKPTAGW